MHLDPVWRRDWPALEEEALQDVEYEVTRDLTARPTSDEGEFQGLDDCEEGGESPGKGDGAQQELLPDPEPEDRGEPSVPLPKTPEETEEHQKVYKMVTMSICLPLSSKSASQLLAGVQELFGVLRRHGYPVARIHTDAGREFDNHPFKDGACKGGSDVQPAGRAPVEWKS